MPSIKRYTQSYLAVGHPEIALRLTTIILAETLCFVKLKKNKMKTIRNLTIALTLITGVVFTSCNKSNDNNPAPGGNSLSLKHDGQAWSASLSVQAVNTNGVINVTGSDSNANQAAIVVYQANGPGTYKIGPGGNAGNMGRWTQGIGTTDTFSASNVIGSGEVTFTELTDTKAKGTFKFTAYNTTQAKVEVTEGQFDVNF